MQTKVYNFFDEKGDIQSTLYWMGDNYVEYIINVISDNFQKQVPGSAVYEVTCLKEPVLKTIYDKNGAFQMGVASFELKVLIEDGNFDRWNLYLEAYFEGTLGETEYGFEIFSDVKIIKEEKADNEPEYKKFVI